MAHARARQQHGGPATRPRSLRIGIILGGKIVEEKLIRRRELITIGQSAKNTFSVPLEGLPRSWPLFLVKDGKYYLHFNDAMDGRVSDGSGVHPLPATRGNAAQRHADGWVLPLPETSRGKLVLGDMTLLFQFVTAPPLQPRPHLPASVRGSLADRLDPHLAVIVTISLLAHLSLMVYARCFHDPPKKRVDLLYEETFPEQFEDPFQQPKAIDVKIAGEGEGKADKPDEGKDDKPDKPSGKKGTTKKGSDGNKGKASTEELEQKADNALAMMWGDDSTAARTTGTRMEDRDPGGDLHKDAKNVEEGRTTMANIDEATDTGPNRSNAKRGTTTGPDVDKPTGTKGTGTTGGPRVPEPEVKPKDPEVDEKTSLSPSAIIAKIRRQYVHGLKTCFRKVLKIDESASGTVKLKFQVGERGTVTRAKVLKGFGFPSLDSCVESQAKGWTFGIPKDAEGDPTSLNVTVSLPFAGK